jgi:hypothetical protein
MKTLQRKTKIKMGTSSYERYHAEGRKNMTRNWWRQETSKDRDWGGGLLGNQRENGNVRWGEEEEEEEEEEDNYGSGKDGGLEY